MALKNALVVDDSKSARMMLQRLLQKQQLEVEVVTCGEEALEYVGQKQPDIIFMDHTMPGLDGLQTTEKIKADSVTAAIPIVMYTSEEGDTYQKRADAAGAVAILPKPAKPPILKQILDNLERQAAEVAPAFEAAAAEDEMTSEEVTKLAENAAEAFVQSAIQPLVERLIEAKVGALRSEIEASVSKALSELKPGTDPTAALKDLDGRIGAVSATLESAQSAADENARSLKAAQEEQLNTLRAEITGGQQRLEQLIQSAESGTKSAPTPDIDLDAFENKLTSSLTQNMAALKKEILETASQQAGKAATEAARSITPAAPASGVDAAELDKRLEQFGASLKKDLAIPSSAEIEKIVKGLGAGQDKKAAPAIDEKALLSKVKKMVQENSDGGGARKSGSSKGGGSSKAERQAAERAAQEAAKKEVAQLQNLVSAQIGQARMLAIGAAAVGVIALLGALIF